MKEKRYQCTVLLECIVNWKVNHNLRQHVDRIANDHFTPSSSSAFMYICVRVCAHTGVHAAGQRGINIPKGSILRTCSWSAG